MFEQGNRDCRSCPKPSDPALQSERLSQDHHHRRIPSAVPSYGRDDTLRRYLSDSIVCCIANVQTTAGGKGDSFRRFQKGAGGGTSISFEPWTARNYARLPVLANRDTVPGPFHKHEIAVCINSQVSYIDILEYLFERSCGIDLEDHPVGPIHNKHISVCVNREAPECSEGG